LPLQDRIEAQEPQERPGNWAFQLALSLLGPLFFLSYFLSLLSPLPILYLHSGTADSNRGRFWSAFAILLGFGLCFSIKGLPAAVGFFLFSGLPALVLGEVLLRKKGASAAVMSAALAVLLAVSAVIGAGQVAGFDLVQKGKEELNAQMRLTAENFLARNPDDLPPQTREDLTKLKDDPSQFYTDLPGWLSVGLILLCALPTLALIRWNPKGFLRRTGIPRDFLRKWRAPEWLVWVALFCGAFHVFEVEILSEISRNALKPLLLIYFFQGMSILAYFLDSLRLRGPIRILLYGLGTIFLTPMVVSFGFFDLWFNFRGRHKPKTEETDP